MCYNIFEGDCSIKIYLLYCVLYPRTAITIYVHSENPVFYIVAAATLCTCYAHLVKLKCLELLFIRVWISFHMLPCSVTCCDRNTGKSIHSPIAQPLRCTLTITRIKPNLVSTQSTLRKPDNIVKYNVSVSIYVFSFSVSVFSYLFYPCQPLVGII
jgi:hypothetical protein